MKTYNFKSKLYFSLIILTLYSISPVLSQIELKPMSKATKINMKNSINPDPYSSFKKIKVINNVNYSNYVYTFYTKSNRVIKGSVLKVEDSYVKVKIQKGYKEHKHMYIPFDNISHFQEHYSGE